MVNVFFLGKNIVGANFMQKFFLNEDKVKKFYVRKSFNNDNPRTEKIGIKNLYKIIFRQPKKIKNVFIFYSPYDIILLLIFRILGREIVYAFHDFKLHKGEENYFVQYSLYLHYILANHVIVFNKNVEISILKSFIYKISAKKITVLNHGVVIKDNPIKKYNRDSTLRLLFFGRIHEYKGLDILLYATKYLDNNCNYILTICGMGSIPDYLMDIINTNTKIVLNNKWVDDIKVDHFFSVSHLLILPYKGATQSGVMCQAYEYNMPIIITPDDGLVNQAFFGKLVSSSFEPYELARQIINVYNNPELLEKLSNEININKSILSYNNITKTFFASL
jgi:glycosyltransferase involved in cell wall biosynthesis